MFLFHKRSVFFNTVVALSEESSTTKFIGANQGKEKDKLKLLLIIS